MCLLTTCLYTLIAGPPPRPVQQQERRQAQQRNPPVDSSLATLLEGIQLNNPKTPKKIDDDEMLIHHYYSWHEAIAPREEETGGNIRLKRLTIDLLLPGPTTLEQIKAIISEDGKVLHFTYRPPKTYLSNDRTTVRLALGSVGRDGVNTVRETMQAANRSQAHRTALETVRADQREKVRHIALPFVCDRNFCRRDDWGRDNRTHGLEIGMYQHEAQAMRDNNQYVWILHIELSAAERPKQLPTSPGAYGAYQEFV